MSNNRILNIIIFAIVGGVYSLIDFALLYNQSALFWISYIFTMIAVIMPIIIQISLFRAGDYPKRVFLGLPIMAAAFIYLIVQAVAGFALQLLPENLYIISVIAQVIILAVFVIFSIATLMMKNSAESFEANVGEKRLYLQELVSDVQGLIDITEDALLKKKLNALAEALRFSDPMSHDSLAPLEAKIETLTAELDGMVRSGGDGADGKIKEIENSLTERNRKAKALK